MRRDADAFDRSRRTHDCAHCIVVAGEPETASVPWADASLRSLFRVRLVHAGPGSIVAPRPTVSPGPTHDVALWPGPHFISTPQAFAFGWSVPFSAADSLLRRGVASDPGGDAFSRRRKDLRRPGDRLDSRYRLPSEPDESPSNSDGGFRSSVQRGFSSLLRRDVLRPGVHPPARGKRGGVCYFLWDRDRPPPRTRKTLHGILDVLPPKRGREGIALTPHGDRDRKNARRCIATLDGGSSCLIAYEVLRMPSVCRRTPCALPSISDCCSNPRPKCTSSWRRISESLQSATPIFARR